MSYLKERDILNAPEFKPIIDGTALAKALQMRPGPWMREALEVVMAWQLRNPDETDIEGALQAVKNNKGELTTCLIQHFLQLTIRPFFAKTPSPHITEKGHKNLNNAPPKYGSVDVEDEESIRPWKKSKNEYVLHLLTWVVRSLDFQLTERNWQFLVPPLLALIDDVEPVYKAKGCQLVSGLLKSTPPALLKRTGLTEVFTEAITLCLSYLPTLTPEDDSILLLSEAYPALFELVELKSATVAVKVDQKSLVLGLDRHKMEGYSNILHSHILPSIGHVADSNPRIIITLLTQLIFVINAKTFNIIEDIVRVIPLLKSLLTAPFAAAYPALLTAVTKAMQHVLANAWPRATVWRAEILEGVCLSWIQIVKEEARWTDDQSSSPDGEKMLWELGEAKQQLKICALMLINAVEALQRKSSDSASEHDVEKVDIRSELQQLVAVDARLAGAFP